MAIGSCAASAALDKSQFTLVPLTRHESMYVLFPGVLAKSARTPGYPLSPLPRQAISVEATVNRRHERSHLSLRRQARSVISVTTLSKAIPPQLPENDFR